MKQWLKRYRRGIGTSLRNNSAAFGYSIVVTSNFATLQYFIEPPGLREVYLFTIGAVAAFALLEAVASKLFRKKLSGEPSEVIALGSALSILSITAAIGTTNLTAWLVRHWIAWPIGAFVSTLVYLLVVALEMAFAEKAEKK